MIKNANQMVGSLEAWVRQVESSTTKRFRADAMSMFKFLLETTPQSTGKAVANWKIGINTPDLSWDPNVGELPEIRNKKDGTGSYPSWTALHKKGDKKWIEYAVLEEGYKLGAGSRGGSGRAKLGDVIYFTNNVQGDDDGGASSVNYLNSLQDPGYWSTKLREVNQPYITVAEALLIHSWSGFADGGSNYLEEFV